MSMRTIDKHQLPAWFEAIQELQYSEDVTLSRQTKAMELMLLTGMRRSEILKSRWSCINLVDLVITVPEQSAKNHMALDKPITPRVKEILESLKGVHDVFVFPSASTKNTPILSINQALAELKDKTELYTQAHVLRRAYASAALAAGVPQQILKVLMNHLTDSEVTEGYQTISLDVLMDYSQLIEDYLLTESGVIDKTIMTDATDNKLKREVIHK